MTIKPQVRALVAQMCRRDGAWHAARSRFHFASKTTLVSRWVFRRTVGLMVSSNRQVHAACRPFLSLRGALLPVVVGTFEGRKPR